MRYPGAPVVVLANREPFRHELGPDGRIVVARSASGLVTALEPLVEASGGVWVAHGSGTADRLFVDARDGLNVPPANPRYRLRRIWLDSEEVRGYYHGFSNEALWPLCHNVHVQPVFRSSDFEQYRRINMRFARAAHDEACGGSPLVLVQDYHFALAPLMIRRRLPQSTIVAFWHIPWPHPREFSICPWRRQLLEGLLGSTLLGFQTQQDCESFLDTVEREPGVAVDRSAGVVTHEERATLVRPCPVGIDWDNRYVRELPGAGVCRASVYRDLDLPPDALLAVGVDRMDYTKGIAEKLRAVECLLERHPEMRRRFVLLQVAEPSRESLPAYRDARLKVRNEAARVNERFGEGAYRPVILLETHHEPAEVYRFFRAANLCYVGSLHDGMNLVAKEFVCARDDERGALVLSAFAGAAGQLAGALLVNPYDFEAAGDALYLASRMPDGEQRQRMRAMRAVVARSNVYWWAERLLNEAARRSPALDVTPSTADAHLPLRYTV
jgi:trehalose 6-phosphate synthase